jgi:hypothetical protein
MIFLSAIYALAGLLFLVIYFGIYRPLYSAPFPGELLDVIPAVAGIRLAELERYVSEEMTVLMAESLTPREQRIARKRRRQVISAGLAPIEADARLCLAFSRPKVRQLRNQPPGPRSERDRLIEDLFEQAQYCCLLLTFAKVSRTLMPWDAGRMITFHREIVLKEVRRLLLVFLQLSGTYGEHHRSNLLACLDCWELDEEFC